MRIIFSLVICLSCISLQAQIGLPVSGINYAQPGAFGHYTLLNDSNSLHIKWSVTPYAGVSTSWLFLNRGNATIFSAPMGLQVNRRLNNNLYAFAGVAAAPAYFNFNRSAINADANKNFLAAPRFNTNGFGISSRIEAGLMYVNDDKTFSISGSIGIERNNYPFYPANRVITQKQPLTGIKQ